MKIVKRPDGFFMAKFTYEELKADFVKLIGEHADLNVNLDAINFREVFQGSHFVKNWKLQRAACELNHPQPQPHLPPFSQIIAQRIINHNRLCAMVVQIDEVDEEKVALLISAAGPLARDFNDLYGMVDFNIGFRWDIVDSEDLEIYGIDVIYK